jgi:hypothetical protein
MAPNARVAATVTNINVYFHLVSRGKHWKLKHLLHLYKLVGWRCLAGDLWQPASCQISPSSGKTEGHGRLGSLDHRLHMVCAESADGKFSSTSKMVTDQIAMLNSAYAAARFRFTLSNVIKHVNKNWYVFTARCAMQYIVGVPALPAHMYGWSGAFDW